MTNPLQDKLAQAQRTAQTQQTAANKIAIPGLTSEGKAMAEALVNTNQERIFFGEFSEFHTFLTPAGKPVSFYRGFCKTSDPEVIEYCESIKDVTEVTGKVKEIPVPPSRARNRNWASARPYEDPSVVNPLDILKAAIQSSAQIPQVAESNSST